MNSDCSGKNGCNFFACNWKLPAYTVELTILAFLLAIGAVFAYNFSAFFNLQLENSLLTAGKCV